MEQKTLAMQGGVSLNAIKNIENGKGATTKTMLRVLRVFGKEDWISMLAPVATINPLFMVKNKPARERARERK
jgi:DNA-binding XRE family transcriptional regulator